MAALPQCDAFAYIYDQAGDPAPDVLVVLKRVIDASGNPILLGPKTALTDSAGSFHFTLPEFATAFISARASALWNCPEGRAFTVPPGPSGELVPDFSLPASTLVEPPLVYVGDVLSIPKASATQDGYLSAADYIAFLAGTEQEVGVVSFNTRTGEVVLLKQDIIAALGYTPLGVTIPGVAGHYSHPADITVNAQGQIIAITSGAPDTTAPIITLVSTTGITGTTVTITWHTNEPADSQVEYGPTTAYGSSTTLDTAPVLDHTVSISGLTPSTLYHFRVKSKDTAGNPQTSGDNMFTTTAVVDTTPPVISAITATSITDTGVTINWTTDEASDSQVEYGPTTSYGTTTAIGNPVPPGTISHSAILSGLTASTLYHYRVKSRNAASLLQTSGDNTFTTTAPVVSADLLTDLLAYWKLDESTGTRADSAVGAHALTPAAAFATSASKSGFNICPHFVGTANYLYGPDNAFPLTSGLDYTMAVWLQIEDKSVNRTFISKSGGAGHDEYVLSYEGAQLRYTVQSDSGTYFHVAAADIGDPAVDTWYLVVFWHKTSDSTIHIQVNNGADNSFTLVEPIGVCDAPFRLGCYGAGAAYLWYGLIDEVAIWQHRILDAAARAALWNGSAGKPFDTW